MIVKLIDVCAYCGSPRLTYRSYTDVEGFSLVGWNDLLHYEQYDIDYCYCQDCQDDTHPVDAILVYIDDVLCEILCDVYPRHTIALYEVPYEKDGDNIYFNDKPVCLGECEPNDILNGMVELICCPEADPETKRSAFRALMNILQGGVIYGFRDLCQGS